MLVITGFIQNFGDSGYLAWADGFKGLVVQGKTVDEVKIELWKSLKVKIAFDYKLDINSIQQKEIKSLDDLPLINEGETEDQFQFALMN